MGRVRRTVRGMLSTRPGHTIGLASTVVLAAVLVAQISPVAAASADTRPSGVDLHLTVDADQEVNDGAPVVYRFHVSNDGTERATSVTLRWAYQQPVEPAQPTDGGYVDVHVARPRAAHCSVDTAAHLVVCHLNPIAPGASTSVTFAGTGEAGSATFPGLFGSFHAEVHSAVRDLERSDNSIEGGWVVDSPR